MFPFSTAILMLQNKGPWVTLLTYITTIANFDCIYAPIFYCVFKTAIQSEILSLPKSVLSKSHHCQENFAHRIVHLT